ncbi:unnamed protein product [Adineta steineri]|uniref:Uncharacterized protein n=1 Tax=Adineta steineri TaxID=433720 RepID=A0A818LDP8_9BILA|nr:unnamed protein product [Adineta steineri]CAF3564568.1 unnamed protein product [Adineta steineri]
MVRFWDFAARLLSSTITIPNSVIFAAAAVVLLYPYASNFQNILHYRADIDQISFPSEIHLQNLLRFGAQTFPTLSHNELNLQHALRLGANLVAILFPGDTHLQNLLRFGAQIFPTLFHNELNLQNIVRYGAENLDVLFSLVTLIKEVPNYVNAFKEMVAYFKSNATEQPQGIENDPQHDSSEEDDADAAMGHNGMVSESPFTTVGPRLSEIRTDLSSAISSGGADNEHHDADVVLFSDNTESAS